MRRDANSDDRETMLCIEGGEIAEAIRRVCQTMQQYDSAKRPALGLEAIGPIPVMGEMIGIDGAALEISVERDQLLGGQLFSDIHPNRLENLIFNLQIRFPIRAVDFVDRQFLRRIEMPGLQLWPLLRLIYTNAQENDYEKDK